MIYFVYDIVFAIINIGLLGYVSIPIEGGEVKTGAISTELNKLHSDLLIAMHTDLSFGSSTDGATAILSSTHAMDLSKGIGIILQIWAAKYDFDPRNGET